jgi:hypothetical protein
MSVVVLRADVQRVANTLFSTVLRQAQQPPGTYAQCSLGIQGLQANRPKQDRVCKARRLTSGDANLMYRNTVRFSVCRKLRNPWHFNFFLFPITARRVHPLTAHP